MKRRFKILTIPQEYDLDTQAQIVCALAVVHNFMKIHDPDDRLFKENNLELDSDEGDTIATQRDGSRVERAQVAARRETIAQAMWKDYQSKKNHA